jgi:hypothetical protein
LFSHCEHKYTMKKKIRKYAYDYPENREVSKDLRCGDKKLIADNLRFSLRYVNYWCDGKRKNADIDRLARIIAETNKAKQSVIDKVHFSKNK